MSVIETYTHDVASHCETGSLRNLLRHAGMSVSEPTVFGIGSGPAFYYLFFAKGPARFPMVGIRNRPGHLVRNAAALLGLDLVRRRFRTAREARAEADRLIDAGTPVAACVDMFYMKYLPGFTRVHAPFHFIVLAGRDGDTYAVSDPYHGEIGKLSADDLEAAWETHAPLAKDNFLYHVRAVPAAIDWRRAVRVALGRTCRAMLPPPGIRRLAWFVGAQGMRTYADAMRGWPVKYRGSVLREGILFNAVGFEDQGTGGAAFRLMYGAFLQEVAERFASPAFADLAARMIAHGQRWRAFSRTLILLGKQVPTKDEEFDDWHAANGRAFQEGLDAASREFLEKADFEERFFQDLRGAARTL
jgi:hypothetical protein